MNYKTIKNVMKKLSEKILWIAFLIMIIFIGYKYIQLKKKTAYFSKLLIECSEESFLSKKENMIQARRDSNELFSAYFQFQNILTTSLDNNVVEISDLISSSKLIYRFSSFACDGCVESDFKILRELGDSIGNENIIILSKYSNLKDARIYYNNLNLPFNYFNYGSELEIPIEKNANDAPCFFILEPNLEVIFPYVSKPSHSIKSAYFQRIIQYYLH